MQVGDVYIIIMYFDSFVLNSKEDIEIASLEKKVKVFLGTRDVKKDVGTEYRAKSIHIHPKRIEMELAHRKKQKGAKGGSYNPYAGPYDITLIKLNKHVDFVKGKVKKKLLFSHTIRL